MSLIKQLWLAILGIILMASGGSFMFTILSAKHYLEQQVQMKNDDNATSLALSISQLDKDPATLELLISAQFNAGHYRSIELLDPVKKPIIALHNQQSITTAPAWFITFLPIEVSAGEANIQDGWKQFGVIHLESDISAAYEALWDSAKKIALWALLLGLVSGFIGAQILKRILLPLHNVSEQALAIERNQFITIPVPKTPEFRAVVLAMNQLSDRIKFNTEQELKRLQSLHLKSNFDSVTGLMNRDTFIKQVDALVSQEQYSNQGVMVIIRLKNLAKINQSHGYKATDSALEKIGKSINTIAEEFNFNSTGRLTGTDFALFHPEKIDANEFTSYVKKIINSVQFEEANTQLFEYLFLSTTLNKMDETKDIYAEADQLLTQNASIIDETNMQKHNVLHIAKRHDTPNTTQQQLSINQLFYDAVEHQRVKLEQYPVLNLAGELIHHECPVRLQLEEGGIWLNAGEFLDTAIELNLLNQIDLLVLDRAIEFIISADQEVSLNISASGINNPEFVANVAKKLALHPIIAKKICFEVPETTAYEFLDLFKSFCKTVKKQHGKVAIEHAGVAASRLSELQDIGLDFIKIDQSLIRDIQSNKGNQLLLTGLSSVAHSLGIKAIAEGVRAENEKVTLAQLGLDGWTGPAIRIKPQ